jgi:dTMP kinase
VTSSEQTVPREAGPGETAAAAYDGLFLAFEGGDGAGKSTQLALLRQWLESLGRTVVVTREPGGTPFGRHVRDLVLHGEHVAPRAEALLFAADRAHHVETLVRPALERGDVVLTDRYLDSSAAYQGAGRDLGADEVRDLSLWATRGLLPDLTVVLDVDPQTGRERRAGVHDRLESEPDDFHGRVRRHFLDLAAQAPQRYLVVPADRSREQIHAAVRERVAALLGVSGVAP